VIPDAAAVGVLVLAGLAAAAAMLAGNRRIRRALATAEQPAGPAPGPAHLEVPPHACFGPPPPRSDGDPEVRQVPTPVGKPCELCSEPVAAGDRGWMRPTIREDSGRRTVTVVPHHAECELLTVAGHLFGVCDCTGWAGHGRACRAAALELHRRITASAHPRHDLREVPGRG
jgi:hypothetical protein